MNYITTRKRNFAFNRIENRHKSFRKQPFILRKYELVQRIIILLIIVSCIALVATIIGQF